MRIILELHCLNLRTSAFICGHKFSDLLHWMIDMKTARDHFRLLFCLVMFSSTCRADSVADRFLFPKDGGIYVGVDYYPEHWPEERWETDLRLMHDAGFNVVRLAEFSWVLFEPEEGKYDWGWLDRFLALAQKYGVHAII